MEATLMPLPIELTTPPVTKMYLVIWLLYGVRTPLQMLDTQTMTLEQTGGEEEALTLPQKPMELQQT